MSNRLVIVGAPTSAGAYAPGQEKAPAALRAAGLLEFLAARGITVDDRGDVCGFRWRADKAKNDTRARIIMGLFAFVPYFIMSWAYMALADGGAIEDGPYSASGKASAKGIYFLLSTFESMGILLGMRMHSASEAALDAYSPRPEAVVFGANAA